MDLIAIDSMLSRARAGMLRLTDRERRQMLQYHLHVRTDGGVKVLRPAHLGHRRHRVVEHRLPRTSDQRSTRKSASRGPCAPETLVSARLGAQQPYRGLSMAKHCKTGQEQVRPLRQP
jgi:hypothetical protein